MLMMVKRMVVVMTVIIIGLGIVLLFVQTICLI